MTEGAHGRPIRISDRHVLIALAAVLVAVSLAYLLRPVRDPDFFWHLKTGEWIAEHRGLPASDPFSVTGASIATTNAHLILTSYWSSQLLFHFVHAAGGMTGIVLLRFALVAALLFVVWKRLRGDPLVDTALLLVFAVWFLEKHAVERPQVISFVLFGSLLLLLDSVKLAAGSRAGQLSPTGGYRGPLLVSLLMLVWGNVHGGFILGQATIIAYLVVEGAKFAHRSLRPVGGEAYRALVIAGIAGILAALVNPNTYHAWDIVLSPGHSWGHGLLITEYASTVEALRTYGDYQVIVEWVLMLLAVVVVVTNLKRVDLTDAVLVAACGFFAFRHVRYGPVFMIAVIPLVGRAFSKGAWATWARPPLIAGALALVLVFARDEVHGVERLRTRDWVDRTSLPVAAADFIAASGLRGNIYNFYNWGGYLIWRLGPEIKVFVDGRGIDTGMVLQASIINLGFEGSGQRQWRALLDKYGVDLVLTPYGYGRQPIVLVNRLRRDPDWAVVWSNRNSIVFARSAALREGRRAAPGALQEPSVAAAAAAAVARVSVP
jgi:hypothetical protein